MPSPTAPAAAAAGGEHRPDRDDHSINEISRPATVTELCCSVPEDCIFERLIVVKGRVSDFAWSDLIGETSTTIRQAKYTVSLAEEPVKKPALPAIHEILKQDLQGLAHAENPPLGGARQSAALWTPQEGAISVLIEPARSTVSEVSSRGFVNYVARDKTENVQRTAAASLETRVLHAAPKAQVAKAGGSINAARRSPARLADLECSDCGYRARTRSDLKYGTLLYESRITADMPLSRKHRGRHDREHKCPFPACPQKQRGFATSNDLDRHLFVIHKINNRRSRSYKCFGQNCSRPNQEWPRLDNFKQHLKKLHPGESEISLLQRSNDWYECRLVQQREHAIQGHPEGAEAPTASLSQYGRGASAHLDRNKDSAAADGA
ncbi:hypothetical protein AYO22_04294 [Fonsecaea multimorphosa]|nr:hypothetical protein AYO22_04294 [Fonsecaea multimorphosa]